MFRLLRHKALRTYLQRLRGESDTPVFCDMCGHPVTYGGVPYLLLLDAPAALVCHNCWEPLWEQVRKERADGQLAG